MNCQLCANSLTGRALQVFALTNYLSMFFPRAALMFEVLQHVYEAKALFSFGSLILDLAAGAPPPACCAAPSDPPRVSQTARRTTWWPRR